MIKKDLLKRGLLITVATTLFAFSIVACGGNKNKEETSISTLSAEVSMGESVEDESNTSNEAINEDINTSEEEVDSSEYESVSEELESLDAELESLEEEIQLAESQGDVEKLQELQEQKTELEIVKEEKESQVEVIISKATSSSSTTNNNNTNKNNNINNAGNNASNVQTSTTVANNNHVSSKPSSGSNTSTSKPSSSNTGNSSTTTKPSTTTPTTTVAQTQPTTAKPTEPQTTAPTTVAPTTVAPTTQAPTTVAPTEPVKQGATPLTAAQVELARQTAIKILNAARVESGASANPTPIVASHGGMNANSRAAEFVDPNMTHGGGSGGIWADNAYMEGKAGVSISGAKTFPLTDAQVVQEITELAQGLLNEPSHRKNIVDLASEEMCIGVASFVNEENGLTIVLIVENYVPW